MSDVTIDLVNAIGDAFNANDIDAVMQYFAEDATFDHAAGPDVNGKRFEALKPYGPCLADYLKTYLRYTGKHWTAT